MVWLVMYEAGSEARKANRSRGPLYRAQVEVGGFDFVTGGRLLNACVVDQQERTEFVQNFGEHSASTFLLRYVQKY